MIEKSGKRICNGWSQFPEEVIKGGLKRIGRKFSLREGTLWSREGKDWNGK